jgi:hypothetical protein
VVLGPSSRDQAQVEYGEAETHEPHMCFVPVVMAVATAAGPRKPDSAYWIGAVVIAEVALILSMNLVGVAAMPVMMKATRGWPVVGPVVGPVVKPVRLAVVIANMKLQMAIVVAAVVHS